MAERLTKQWWPIGLADRRSAGWCGVLAATAWLATIVALPLQSRALTPQTPQVQQAGADDKTLQTPLGRREAASVEKHIATLHAKLHITSAQEPLWQPLAAAMRDNVVQLDGVYAEREKTYRSMSAVDDLKSYGQVQQTHALNVKNLIGPFETLYDSFSASQKKEADETFRSFTDNAVKNSR